MKLTERLRPALLRWDRVLAIGALVLPFLGAMVAGFVWLTENGWLLGYVAVSIALGGLVALLRLCVGWWRSRAVEATPEARGRIRARIDPDWSDAERRAFEAARALIDERTARALPWAELQPLALEIVRRVADASGQRGKGVLDFTLPEALLLIDQVAIRLRSDIRRHLPFADTLSVGTFYWLWTHRETARRVKTHGTTGWRIFRALKSPPVAILREIEGFIAEGHAGFVTGEGTSVVQALLLEEIAVAAVELYSGRLRFSDSELLDLRLAEGDHDRARVAATDTPLRIAVAGQVSAGKSSVVNALLGEDRAETDIVPTTDRPQTYPGELDGTEVAFLDLPGLDGSRRIADAVMAELAEADLVLWTIRASRPARDIDRAAIDRFRAHFEARPTRRMPPVIVVVSFVDELLPRWPYPEHFLPDAAMETVTKIVAAVADDLGGTRHHPVPVVLPEPDWNVDTLRARAGAQIGEALMVQRNRLRVERRASGLREEMTRARRGLRQGFSILTARGSDTGEDR